MEFQWNPLIDFSSHFRHIQISSCDIILKFRTRDGCGIFQSMRPHIFKFMAQMFHVPVLERSNSRMVHQKLDYDGKQQNAITSRGLEWVKNNALYRAQRNFGNKI